MIVKQFVHDGLIFYYTDEVVVSDDRNIIGMYFDRQGVPRQIHRNSTYGGYILNAGLNNKKTEQPKTSEITIMLSFEVVAGADRGGIDLFMKGVVTTDLEEPWNAIATAKWNPNVQDVCGAVVEPSSEDLKGRMSIKTDDFCWDGNEQDALYFLSPLDTTDPNKWNYCHTPTEKPKLRYEIKKLIIGNAE
jgi:hypothetical protein